MAGLPDVSLITSWHGGVPKQGGATVAPVGLVDALEAGVGLLDLYFLNHLDIPWYQQQCQRPAALWPEHADACPLCFAASLEPDDIKCIGDALLNVMVSRYSGRLIGPRPRFAALATFWPFLNSDHEDSRLQSIKAIQNSLLLARHLGCRHVEIVGGSAFSDTDGRDAKSAEERDAATTAARRRRHDQLCEALHQVYLNQRGQALFQIERDPTGKNGPFLCLEVEPGQAFLINDIASFLDVHETLGKIHAGVQARVLLNVDLAHMFLADSDQPNLEYAGQRQHDMIVDSVKDLIGHFHASDHARTHASDLCPGSYHFLEPDYTPWLNLACDLVGRPKFSNTVAIEMEACAEIHEVLRSVGRTRSWARSVLPPHTTDADTMAEGAILSVDVVGSTQYLAGGGIELNIGADRINWAISDISRVVQRQRGSVYSFTGDGVVAIFDEKHYTSPEECAQCALEAADRLFEAMKQGLGRMQQWRLEEEENLALRISLHWGKVVIPTAGPLAHQALGRDVIIACRLMNACDPTGRTQTITHRVNQAISAAFFAKISPPALQSDDWIELNDQDLRGKFKGVHFLTVRGMVAPVRVRRTDSFRRKRSRNSGKG